MSKTKYPALPVMLVDDELEALKVVDLSLRQEGISNIIKCQNSSEVTELLSNQNFSVIVLDLTMPEISGQELIPIIARDYPQSVILVLTANNDIETAVNCMKAGAFDYLVKPIGKDSLMLHMKRAIKHCELQTQMEALKESFLTDNLKKPEAFSSIITKNPKMLKIFKYLEAIANTNLTILITGDTGVGKDLFAESIHILSDRKGKFIPVNIAGLDDAMFSDTLFGHKKGAYTGADMSRKGLIEQAEGGTLFLDEIGDLSHASQVKLLQLLQDGKYFPIGSDVPKSSQARILTATNQNIESITKKGIFRKDLFYRLQSHHIHIPPLNERYDDLELLTDFFLQEISMELGKKKPTLPKELFYLLRTYNFPGNIRELKGMVSDAVSRHQRGVLSLKTFQNKIYTNSDKKQKGWLCLNTNEQKENHVLFSGTLPTFREIEEMLIKEALKRAKGNKTLASKMLGIKRQALQNRIKKLTKYNYSIK